MQNSVGPNAGALQLDGTNQASIAAAAECIRNAFGRLDVLENNASGSLTLNSDPKNPHRKMFGAA
jgi:NAD(P)-dependent dehydrogenase (short-subunit alcohol dehydrogenase family)